MKKFFTFFVCLFLSGCASSLLDVAKPRDSQIRDYSFSDYIPLEFKNSNSPLPVEMQSLIGKPVWSYGEKTLHEKFPGLIRKDDIKTAPLEELIVIDAYYKETGILNDLLVRFQRKLDNKFYAIYFSWFPYESSFEDFKHQFAIENPYEKYPEWPQNDLERIKARQIWIGMSREQALYSLGYPQNNNRTVSASVISEQWVYSYLGKGGGVYLYFLNDKLTSWQD